MQIAAALLWSLILASASVADVDQVVQDTYDGGGYQTGHPSAPPPDVPDLPNISPALVVVLKTLMWTCVAVLGFLVAASVVRRLRGRDLRDPPRPHAGAAQAAPPALDAPLGDAEALAEAGRYEEAVHVLLLNTIRALGRHQRIPASLTSREILGRLQLLAAPKEALARLVSVVELSLFGGHAADQETYATCVDAFEALRAALGEGDA